MSLTDKLFGRQELKERIRALEQELEESRERMKEAENKAEEERKRAKEAVARKQELNEKINRQEDKIGSLKDEIRKKEYVKDTMGETFQSNRISRTELKSLLGKMGSMKSEKEDLFTVFLPRGAAIGSLDSDGVLRTDLTLNQLKGLKEEESKTGKVLFYSKNLLSLLLKPPLPVFKEGWYKSQSFKVGPIQEQLQARVGFVFLSSGGSGIAVFGEELEDFRIIQSQIKSKHKKGGFSQGRFEGKRDEEVKKHLSEVEEAAKDFFPEDLELFALSGSEEMVGSFRSSGFLEERELFKRKMNLSKVEGKEGLQSAFKEFWKTTITYI